MGNQPTSNRATKKHHVTRVAVIVGLLLALALAAYGFIYTFQMSNALKLRITDQPGYAVGNENKITEAAAATATCNVAENGGGRCYPACQTSSDCDEKSGAVSAWETCKNKAVELCGLSDSCVAMVCGAKQATCQQGFCTRPKLTLSQAWCAVGEVPPAGKCPTNANCPLVKRNPGNWVGFCPAAKAANGSTVSNCTETDVSKCRVVDEPQSQ